MRKRESSHYCQVALEVPTVALDKLYTYSIPPQLQHSIQPGSRVLAPFRNKMLAGIVMAVSDDPGMDTSRLKPLENLMPDLELPDEFVGLIEWMRARYFTSYASILKTLTPPSSRPKRVPWINLLLAPVEVRQRIDQLPERSFKQKQVLTWLMEQEEPRLLREAMAATGAGRTTFTALAEQGVVSITYHDEFRSPLSNSPQPSAERSMAISLTSEQEAAISAVIAKLSSEQSGQFLLQGITGSGKTEVYLQAIRVCLELGRSAIVLVPEISLTPQLVSRFYARFPGRVAVLHSRMSDGERFDEWRRIKSGDAQVVIGARSAVFAPCRRLGLVILDEEHESSYKQEDHPKYLTREIALYRVKFHQGVLVLGSATPSLETRYLAERGRIKRLLLTKRAAGNPLPDVEIVNMCNTESDGNSVLFSRRMKEELQMRLDQGEQSILFLNRRGYASSLLCQKCGYVPACVNCAVSLTYHQAYRPKALCCHYCGYAEEATLHCPNCGSQHVRQFGTGTERVESELATLFPAARVLRMDVDTTRAKGSHEHLLSEFRAGKADILLGTQMIAKGHDFPNVSFVGILSGDTSLHLPDVRAAERTFQLLTQVAGRAGRHNLLGKVILQTYHADHYAVSLAAKQDYESFYAREIEGRRAMKNPPFWEISLVTISHDQMKHAISVARELALELQSLLSGLRSVIVHDPAPAPIERLHGKHRVHITLRYQSFREIQGPLSAWYERAIQIAGKAGAYVSIDISAQWVV